MPEQLTPQTLRNWAESLGGGVVYTREKLKETFNAHASAWEAQEQAWQAALYRKRAALPWF